MTDPQELSRRLRDEIIADALGAQAARIAELEKALEPFAKASDVKLCGTFHDDDRFGHTDLTFHLTFGDLRRARKALSHE